jgi:uncharacterized protein DUF3160
MRIVPCLVVTCAVVAGVARAGDEAPPPDWRGTAGKAGLAADEVERLAKTKLLVAGAEYRQSFEPYVESAVPTFVTSDSVLNAYHVLLDECVVRLERARAAELPALLRAMWDGIHDAAKRFDLPSKTLGPAVLRAQVAIGTALRLVGGETPGAGEEVAALIAAETARVTKAEERVMPAWLAKPSPGYDFLDYGRFRPRGFYTRDERLSAHFRATAFLQDVRLRIGDDGELVTALVLAEALRPSGKSHERPAAYLAFVGAWESFLGVRGDLPLPETLDDRRGDVWDAESVADARARFARAWHDRNDDPESFGPPTRDEVEHPDEDVLHGVEPSLRVLPATTLPDGRLFDLCCAPSKTPAYPSGLFVAAALGGDLARREALRDRPDETRGRLERAFARGAKMLGIGGAPPLDDMRERAPGEERGRDVYSLYLRALASLLDAPEPDAPAFVRGDAWQAKSTNTALAGWAQMRHTWTLQARESADYGAAESTCAGFVEPDPVFFGRLADCVGATWDLLERAGAFSERLDRRELLWALKDYAAFLRAGGGAKKKRALSDAETRTEAHGAAVVGALGGPQEWRDYETPMSEADVSKALRVADDVIAVLDAQAPLSEPMLRCVGFTTRPFRRTWIQFERLCRRLEAMAQKQLRGAAWDDDEKALLLDYGHVLARAMLYEGNAYLSPPDGAPRATSVYAWLGEPPGYLHAAIARPRSLWVLYPWQGGEVLCRGSVLPYREFVAGQRLTDDEWRARLDGADAPAEPAWLAPITSPPPKKTR